MQSSKIMMGVLFCHLVFSIFGRATAITEMREFVAITDSMAKSGVRIGAFLPSKNPENKSGLLLEIDPLKLMLVPDDFGFRKEEPFSTDLDRLVSIANNIRDMELICQNENVRRKFPEWGVIEPCQGDSANVLRDYMSKVFMNKGRLAISVRDAKDAPIVKLGMLRCQRLDGPCLTQKPTDIELASVMAASWQEVHMFSSPTALGDPAAATTVVSVSVASSTITKAPEHTLNTLDSPPLYKDNFTVYESYLSMLREATSTVTSKSTATYMWVKPLATRPTGGHKSK